jgi:hypothetical protein
MCGIVRILPAANRSVLTLERIAPQLYGRKLLARRTLVARLEGAPVTSPSRCLILARKSSAASLLGYASLGQKRKENDCQRDQRMNEAEYWSVAVNLPFAEEDVLHVQVDLPRV